MTTLRLRNKAALGHQFQEEVRARLIHLQREHSEFCAFRIPDGLKPVYNRREGRVVTMRPEHKTPADFIFSIRGRLGLIEAKSTMEARLPIGERGFKEHQFNAFLTWWESPRMIDTFLIWQCVAAGEVWLVSGREFAAKYVDELSEDGGRRSIPFNWARAVGVRCGPVKYWSLDYLLTKGGGVCSK